MQIFDKQQITNAHVKMKIQKFLNCFQLDESQFQFFQLMVKKKLHCAHVKMRTQKLLTLSGRPTFWLVKPAHMIPPFQVFSLKCNGLLLI